jgi:hypothetical protein
MGVNRLDVNKLVEYVFSQQESAPQAGQ